MRSGRILRNNFYEFTCEQQYTVVPYAKENNIQLYQIDRISSETDTELYFDVKTLVFQIVKQKEGFLGFTTFTEKECFENGLYFARVIITSNVLSYIMFHIPKKQHLTFPDVCFFTGHFYNPKELGKY